ncbi:MAG: hypothetical protein GX815_09380, partial [Clostridiales bacterium]|nr:hypothetical protein [Clostridiales bacterium]
MKNLNKNSMKLMAVILTMSLLIVGCSSNAEEHDKSTIDPGDSSVNIVVMATYVDDDRLASYSEAFDNTMDIEIEWIGITAGDSEVDPMSTMAGMTKLSGMIASGEVDILISDEENALRHGDNGNTFLSLSDAYDEETIAGFSHPPIKLPIRDEEGIETGDETAEVGIDVSDDADLLQATSAQKLSAYIVVNAANMDNAKELFQNL